MARYRLKQEYVRAELFFADAIQWFRTGDHPDVCPIYGAGTMIDSACNHRSDEHGWLNFGSREPQGVCPGDWILTLEATGARLRVRQDDFKRLYRRARGRSTPASSLPETP